MVDRYNASASSEMQYRLYEAPAKPQDIMRFLEEYNRSATPSDKCDLAHFLQDEYNISAKESDQCDLIPKPRTIRDIKTILKEYEAERAITLNFGLPPEDEDQMMAVVDRFNGNRQGSVPFVIKFPVDDESFLKTKAMFVQHQKECRRQFQEALMLRVDEELKKSGLGFHPLSKDDKLELIMAYILTQFGSQFQGVKCRLREQLPGTEETWLQRVAESWKLYLQVWKLDASQMKRSKFKGQHLVQSSVEAAKRNIACIIFWTSMAGDNVSGCLLGGDRAQLKDLRSPAFLNQTDYDEIAVRVAQLWLKCLRVPMKVPKGQKPDVDDKKPDHKVTSREKRKREVAKIVAAKEGAPSEKTDIQVFLAKQPENAADFFGRKAIRAGIWSTDWLAGNLYKPDSVAEPVPNNLLSGLLLPFARMAFMLDTRFHDNLALVMYEGRLWVGTGELTKGTVDGWKKELPEYSKFAIVFDKARTV